MIRLSIQILLFLMTFALEVRVHASEAKAKHNTSAPHSEVILVQQEPANCLRTKEACAIRTREGQVFELVVDDQTKIVLDFSTAMIRVSKNEIRLVSGSVWVKAQQAFQVKTEFGDVVSSGKNEFWVARTSDRVVAKATHEPLELKPRGTSEVLTVDAGLQNYIGRVGLDDGRAETGIPLAIPFRSHLDQWARMYRGPKADFETGVADFHKRWKVATQESADINRAVYERMISSEDDAKKAEAAQQAKVQADIEANRKRFRSRVFDGM